MPFLRSEFHPLNTDAPPAIPYVRRCDYDVAGSMTYEGWAAPGAATDEAVWAIRRNTYAGDKLTASEWADGDTDCNNVWDDRAALDYK